MKQLKKLLNRKNFAVRKNLDEKTIFFIFNKIILSEYGKVGSQSIQPVFYKKGKIFIRAKNSNWAGEIWTSRNDLVKKINQELGEEVVLEIKVKS